MNRKFKKCLITGITGSGGSYLAEYILKKDSNIQIFGLYRSNGYLNFLKKKYKKRIFFYKVDLRKFSKSLTYESHSLTKINKIDNYKDQKVQTDEDISSKKSKNPTKSKVIYI
jgi:GDP-D-mannose dehydratase